MGSKLTVKHNFVALSSDGTIPFVRHRQVYTNEGVEQSQGLLPWDGLAGTRMSFTLRNASNNLIKYDLPDARSILRGTNVSDAPHRDRNNRDMMGETSRAKSSIDRILDRV